MGYIKLATIVTVTAFTMSCGKPLINAKEILDFVDCNDRKSAIPKKFTLTSNCVKPHTVTLNTGSFKDWEEKHFGPIIGTTSTDFGIEAELTGVEAFFKSAKVRCMSGKGAAPYFWLFEFPREEFLQVEDDQKSVSERTFRCSVGENALNTQIQCEPWVRKTIKDENGKVIVDSWNSLLIFAGDTATKAKICSINLNPVTP